MSKITYNINENIEELFKKYTIEKYSITYGMQHREDNTRKKELLITNYILKLICRVKWVVVCLFGVAR